MNGTRTLFLLSLSLLPATSLADELHPVKVDCEGLESLTEQVTSCSANSVAVESAMRCRDSLVRAWNEAPKDLNRVLSISQARDNSRQQAELAFSKTDYQKTIAKLENLIAVTERNTALVAEYPRTMLYDPDFQLNCYDDNFQQVQEIVWELDDKLEEGKATLAKAGSLRGISDGRELGVASDTINRVLASEPREIASAPPMAYVKGRSPSKRSDITGTERSREKEILTSFKIRDQLTGP